MTKDEYNEWVILGNLPKRKGGRLDLVAIEKGMRTESLPSWNISLLKRIMEHVDGVVSRRPRKKIYRTRG